MAIHSGKPDFFLRNVRLWFFRYGMQPCFNHSKKGHNSHNEKREGISRQGFILIKFDFFTLPTLTSDPS